ncbi:MAG: rod shape-determining protein MreC [Flavobacteriales bacterium]
MKNVLLFFKKIRFILFFMLLQLFVLFLIQRNSSYQQAQILNSSAGISGWMFQKKNAVFQYFNLKSENQKLLEENSKLKQEAFYNYSTVSKNLIEIKKKEYERQFSFQPATVIQNSTSRDKNILTLNVGSLKEINPEMGVVNSKGIVGFVKNVSNNFSTVMSAMNIEFKIPVRPLQDSCVGTLMWLPENKVNEITVKGIPSYFKIKIGDTIVTQGGSGIFPQGEMVGIVKKSSPESGNNNQLLTLKTTVDFFAVHHVFVVNNIQKSELDSVINSINQ